MRNTTAYNYVLQLTSSNEREGSASVDDTSGGGENRGRRAITDGLVNAPEFRSRRSPRDGATQTM